MFHETGFENERKEAQVGAVAAQNFPSALEPQTPRFSCFPSPLSGHVGFHLRLQTVNYYVRGLVL